MVHALHHNIISQNPTAKGCSSISESQFIFALLVIFGAAIHPYIYFLFHSEYHNYQVSGN
jgi:hypothetical protein